MSTRPDARAKVPRERECGQKRAYYSRKKARHQARSVPGRAYKLHAYRCSVCGFWHIGRATRAA